MGALDDPCCPAIRQRRTPTALQLVGGTERTVITAGWLQSCDREEYRRGVKQALLIGATDVCFHRFKRHYDEWPGDTMDQFRLRLQHLLSGSAEFPLPGNVRSPGASAATANERHLLVKYGALLNGRHQRLFSIEGGESARRCRLGESARRGGQLIVYRTSDPEGGAAQHSYDLVEVECHFEQRGPAGKEQPPFEDGYSYRVRVSCPERKSGPMFLYAAERALARLWVQTIRMAKRSVLPEELAALQACAERASRQARRKGWDALLAYCRSLAAARRRMRKFEAWSSRAELRRGWAKLRAVYAARRGGARAGRSQSPPSQERGRGRAAAGDAAAGRKERQQARQAEADKRRPEQQDAEGRRAASEKRRAAVEAERLAKEKKRRAAKLLRDGLAAARARRPPWTRALGAEELRQALVSQVQGDFRKYRSEAMSSRTYPLAPSAKSLVQQAQQGLVLDASFEALTCGEALRLCLHPAAFELWSTSPEALRQEQVASAGAGLRHGPMHVQLSECGSLLLLSEPGQVEWQQFVPLSRISSVVLHAAPTHSAAGSTAGGGGACLAVHGPRVAWARRLAPQGGGVVGTDNGLDLVDALLAGKSVQWLRAVLSLKAAHLPAVGGSASTSGASHRSRAVVYLLGRHFASEVRCGEDVDYGCRFEASVPLPVGPAALAALESQVLRVDVERLPEFGDRGGQVAFTGYVQLKRLLAGSAVEPHAGAAAASEPPLAVTLRGGAARHAWRLVLAPVGAGAAAGGEASLAAELEVEVQTPVVPGPTAAELVRVSPEIIARGPVTALHCSQRGAWFDPELGPGQLQLSHAADFAEFSVGALRFPMRDPPSATQLHSYHVEVSCCGALAATPTVHRPRPSWSRIVPLDPGQVAFKGARLFLPLPPGFWSSPDRPAHISLSVFRHARQDLESDAAVSYRQLLEAPGAARGARRDAPEKAYHAVLSLHGLLADGPKREVSLLLGGAASRPPHCELDADAPSDADADACAALALGISLRDRDYVWARSEAEAEADRLYPLCVGDRAILGLEEALADARPRAEPAGESLRAEAAGDGEVPLREPRWPHEITASGLTFDERQRRRLRERPVRQGRPPPHKFELPASERDMQRRRLPGVFWRILDRLAEGGDGDGDALAGESAKCIVKRLSHAVQPVACTLLAVCADGTCDVELSGHFLHDWASNPERRYFIPGSAAVVAAAAGSSSETARVLLKGVPVMQLAAVHAAGFNVYDADAGTPEEAAAQDAAWEGGRDTGTRGPSCRTKVAAGPVPADANPAVCQYEWSLHCSAESEEVLHRFVLMLQQCVRRDHARQTRGSQEQAPGSGGASAAGAAARAALADDPRRAPNMGQLEVLLVEARRLRPARERLALDSFDAFFAAATPMEKLGAMFADAELNVSVRLRFLQGGKALNIRGDDFLMSPTVLGSDSPDWRQLKGLESRGGWAFRSPHLSPGRMPDLLLELEVLHKDISQEYLIGSVQLPVTKGGFLVNPDAPFRDLWLPLTSAGPDGSRLVNPSGDIHVMTLWTAATGEGRRAERSLAFAHFRSKVESLLLAGSLRDPLHGASVGLLGHRPLPAVGGCPGPLSRAEALAARAAGVLAAGPLLECCEQRRLLAWGAFRSQLAAQGHGAARLGELRLLWLEAGQTARVRELESLLAGGVPSSWRHRVWPDIALSSRLQGQQPGGGVEEYRALLRRGRRLHSPALRQLREDLAVAAARSASSEDVRRLSRAGDVCTALLAVSADCEAVGPSSARSVAKGHGQLGCCRGVAYCEALLEIASGMLLPGCMEASGDQDQCIAESNIFWLLLTLIATRTNGAFRDYFAAPAPAAPASSGDSAAAPPINKAGAMGDVFLLDCALVLHEPELWVRLGAAGFQLASVFYGAFASWFAKLLPPASLLRLWDQLMAESSNPRAFPHPRRGLVDFAFGVLRARRAMLLQCQSALEMRDGLLASFSTMDDPQSVTEAVAEAAGTLWSGLSRNQVLRLWSQGTEAYSRFYAQHEQQDAALRAFAAALAPNGMPALAVVHWLAPRLWVLFGGAGRSGVPRGGGNFRAVPPELLERTPPAEQGGLSALLRLLAASGRPPRPGQALPCPPGCEPEPAPLAQAEWVDKITRSFPGVGAGVAREVYEAFSVADEGHMSLYELTIGLVCCSKGTVAEKAAALFDVYSFWDARLQGQHGLRHLCPATRLAKVVEGGAAAIDGPPDRFAVATAPPPPEGGRGAALHLRIWSDRPEPNAMVGEVVISVLGPFLTTTSQDVDPLWFSIWGEPAEEALPHKLGNSWPPRAVPWARAPPRALVGELRLALAWEPRRYEDPSVGQLRLRLFAIRFFGGRVASKHLQVTVTVYDDHLHERLVPAMPVSQEGPARVAGRAVEFQARLVPKPEGAEGARQEPAASPREWAPVSEAEQRSVLQLPLRPECLGPVDRRPNAVHLHAVRALVEALLRRGRHPLTNRQAALFADAAFSRAGVAAGILDAVIVPGENLTEFRSVAELREAYASGKKALADVTQHLHTELERRACSAAGSLDLPLSRGSAGTFLKSMGITDPFPGQPKVLWLRFVCAGTGERRSRAFQLSEVGNVVQPTEVRMDLARGDLLLPALLSREEFISCALASPLVGETLRLASAAGASGEQAPLTLDAAVCCPSAWPRRARGVLLELWGRSGVKGDGFLAEAWLPPLDDLVGERHELSLSLHCNSLSQLDGTASVACSTGEKAALALPRNCGTIFLSAQWLPPKEGAESQAAASSEPPPCSKAARGGALFLQVQRAVNLDAPESEDLGAYLRGFLLDCSGGRPQVVHGLGTALFMTKTRAVQTSSAAVGTRCSTVKWDEDVRVAFPAEGAAGRPGAPPPECLELPVLFGSHGDFEPGEIAAAAPAASLQACSASHAVEVYLTDTVESLKEKVGRACQEIVQRSEGTQASSRLLSMLRRYRDVSIGSGHVVLVFAPSPSAGEPRHGGKSPADPVEAFLAQHRDPASWHPLDPLQTLAHYAELFGFGKAKGACPPLVRIAPLTESLRCQSYRCRRFALEQQAYESGLEDLNDTWRCFGHALYRHDSDGGSVEWRPCMVHGCPEMSGPSHRTHKVSWPLFPDPSEKPVFVEEAEVLLAPAGPALLGPPLPAHAEVLVHAVDLHGRGRSDGEIAEALNAHLLAGPREAADGELRGSEAPPPVTASVVRSYLHRHGGRRRPPEPRRAAGGQ